MVWLQSTGDERIELLITIYLIITMFCASVPSRLFLLLVPSGVQMRRLFESKKQLTRFVNDESI